MKAGLFCCGPRSSCGFHSKGVTPIKSLSTHISNTSELLRDFAWFLDNAEDSHIAEAAELFAHYRGDNHRCCGLWGAAFDLFALSNKAARRTASSSESRTRKSGSDPTRVLDSVSIKPQSLATVRDFIESKFVPQWVWSLKPATKQFYTYLLEKHVIPELGSLRLRDVNDDDVQALINGSWRLDSRHARSRRSATRSRQSSPTQKRKNSMLATTRSWASECRRLRL